MKEAHPTIYSKWSFKLPILLGIYDLLLFALIARLPGSPRETPPLFFIIGQSPVIPPVYLLMPPIAHLAQRLTGTNPGGPADTVVFVGLPLACWISYGIIIGAIIDRMIATTQKGRKAAESDV
jgi:hypothetical protein